ncbi:MAG: class I SAM-dependent methyltransferase [Lachnospiraceae bacterium]|nr:class I SAM-dependent methyltransferase [Lachnospiraceae bacterium]
MEMYTDFAGVYDTFMDEVPYQEWADFLEDLIRTYGISRPAMERAAGRDGLPEKEAGEEALLSSERNLVLDLGCGTGTLTELLAGKGFDMIGIDLSQEMLNIAMEKKERSGSNVLYLCQDMRMLDLYSTVGTVVSVCDSLNYLLEDEEVVETFSLVNRYLYPGGIFIFDFNTVYKYEHVIGDATIAENREDCSFIWENYYHAKEHVNEYDLTVFAREAQGDLFGRFFETHYQRGYTLEEMENFVKQAGMKVELILDADTRKAPDFKSERIYIVAREKGKVSKEA